MKRNFTPPSIDYMKTASNINELRKSNGLTIEKFAELLDYSPRTIGAILRGERLCSIEILYSCIELFEVDLKSLVVEINHETLPTISKFIYSSIKKAMAQLIPLLFYLLFFNETLIHFHQPSDTTAFGCCFNIEAIRLHYRSIIFLMSLS